VVLFIAFDRIFLYVILLVASMSKFFSIVNFRDSLKELKLSAVAAKFYSWGIPLLEVTAATLLLLSGPLVLAGEVALWLLLGGFSWSIWKAYRTGLSVKCNCFGDLIDEKIGLSTIMKVILMASLGIFLWVGHESIHSIVHLPLQDVLQMVYSSVYIILIYAFLMASINKSSSVVSIRNSIKKLGGER